MALTPDNARQRKNELTPEMARTPEIRETALDNDDYLEEMSSESSSLTPTTFRAIISKTNTSSQSSGLGSLGTDSEQVSENSSNHRTVYVDTTTDLPSPTPKGSAWRMTGGALIMFLSVASFVYTPFEMLLNERLKMVPGFPAYDWWVEPPDEVLLKVYMFNVTNSEEFMSGEDSMLKMEQVGPFVYQEKLVHTDVVFNDNGTLTYTAHRSAVFQPHLTNISLDATLVVPNLAVLGGASFLSDSSFVSKLGFNMMVSRTRAQVFSVVSAQNYMWNWTDPLLNIANKLIPFVIPVENMGILQRTVNLRCYYVIIIWVPGHTDIPGKEEADRLARMGSFKVPFIPIPWSQWRT